MLEINTDDDLFLVQQTQNINDCRQWHALFEGQWALESRFIFPETRNTKLSVLWNRKKIRRQLRTSNSKAKLYRNARTKAGDGSKDCNHVFAGQSPSPSSCFFLRETLCSPQPAETFSMFKERSLHYHTTPSFAFSNTILCS